MSRISGPGVTVECGPPVTSLKHLTMKDSPYRETFEGLETLEQPQSLDILFAQRLKDFSGLWHASPSLRVLDLEAYKGLTNLDFLSHITGLTYLGIGDCGAIASLGPVALNADLIKLIALDSTTIEDKDLSPLLKLPKSGSVSAVWRRSVIAF